MGKTSKPLRLLVEQSLTGPETAKLAEQGHTIVTMVEENYDLILGPHCWRMERDPDDGSLSLLEAALKHARRLVYDLPNKALLKGQDPAVPAKVVTRRKRAPQISTKRSVGTIEGPKTIGGEGVHE